MKRLPFLILGSLFLAVACGAPDGVSRIPTGAPSPSPTPASVVYAEDTARAFLKAWGESNYSAMYTLLTPSSQATLTAVQFAARYQDIVTEATIRSIQPTLPK